MRIRLRNFMTYSDITLKPGPKLNIILGPNGTGKSAIVCSIIVGLGGDVSLTGRASTITALVQWNCDWCSTEIELYNDCGRNYVVERKIIITGRNENKIDHRSEWRINNRNCNKQDIKKLTTELSIEVDNLCQFLPQDKVEAFVGMNSCQLLTSTLKAVGDNQLVKDHAKLVKMTDEICENERKLARLKEDCQHNEVNARRLEADVEKLKERQELVKLKSICSDKIHYVRHQEAKKNVQDAKETLATLQADLHRAESSCAPYQKSLQFNQSQEVRYKQIMAVCEQTINGASSHRQRTRDSVAARKLACREEYSKFSSKKMQEEHREKAISLKRQELEAYESKLQEVADIDHTDRIAELDQKIADNRQKVLQYNRERADLEDTQRRIHHETLDQERNRERIRSVREKRINLLKLRRPEAYTMATWIDENKAKFRGRILPPMMIDINIKDPRDAAIIEHAIPGTDLFAFVCEYEEDLKVLTDVARNQLKVRINVILRPDKTVEEFESEMERRTFPSDMNFKGYLKDLISAPEPIMRYLCGSQNFHRTPVFGELSEANLKRLLQSARRFYSLDKCYIVSKSRYDNKQMTVTDSVRDAQQLVHSLDSLGLQRCEAEIKRLKDLKQQTADEMAAKLDQLERANEFHQALAEKFTGLKRQQEQRSRFEGLIKQCKDSIAKLSEEAIDLEKERAKLVASIKRINLLIIKDCENLANIEQGFVSAKEIQKLNLVLCRVARENYRRAQRKYEEAKKDQSRLTDEIRKQRERIKTLQLVVERLRKAAEEQIPGFRDLQLDKRTKKSFAMIAEDTVDALEDKLSVLKAKIQGIYQDKNVEAEFRRQHAELLDKRQQIASLEASVAAMDTERRELKQAWKPKLEQVVGRISVNFQEFIRRLNCDGEVKLSFDAAKPEDLSQYGIAIKVKYRDDEVSDRTLSSSHLSGGERVVATMLYMLALQPMTSVPFRCLDEINQGMDAHNERKLFEFLDRTAHESSSQYILVSPKLLKNLPYSENMKIHLVFNGPQLDFCWDGLMAEEAHDDVDHRHRPGPSGDDDDQDDTEIDEATDVESDTDIEEL